VIGKLVVLDVRPGSGYDSQSGLQLLAPKIYARIAGDEGGSGDRNLAFVVVHPTSNFMGHYLIEPLARRGCCIVAVNTRFVANDSTLVMERAIQDLGAAVKFLRREGYKRIVLIGNSGGGALAAMYQSQAENLTLSTTPDGAPIDLSSGDLPPADCIAMMAAHPGRAHTLCDWIDPAVVDERDMYATNLALDMFNPDNGPPYKPEWVGRYRAAQRARNERLTDWALERLGALERRPDRDAVRDEPFIVYRTMADPRFNDLSLDSNDRTLGTTRGTAYASNYGPNAIARFSTLRSFLSQWSRRLSRADGPACLAATSVPVLNVGYSADNVVFPSQIAMWKETAGARCINHTLKGGTHHLAGQKALIEELADLAVDWAKSI